jgi:hypothetical protein
MLPYRQPPAFLATGVRPTREDTMGNTAFADELIDEINLSEEEPEDEDEDFDEEDDEELEPEEMPHG